MGYLFETESMKLNISFPATGCQKLIEIDDEIKLRHLYDKRMSHEIEGDVLGEDFKGYIFRISGGNDKQGFSMKQGVLRADRVRLLVGKGASCFRERLQHKRQRKAVKRERYVKSKADAEHYNALLQRRNKESREKRKQLVAKRRSESRKLSTKSNEETA